LEEALRAVSDPLIANTRKAAAFRNKVVAALLERAGHRLTKGLHDEALRDCDTVLEVASDHAGALELRAKASALQRGERGALEGFEASLREAKARLERGDCDGAASAVARAEQGRPEAATEIRAWHQKIEARRRVASERLAEAVASADSPTRALELVGAARALDVGITAGRDGQRAAKALAPALRVVVDGAADSTAGMGGAAAQWPLLRRWLQALPALGDEPSTKKLVHGVVRTIVHEATQALGDAATAAGSREDRTQLAEAIQVVHAWDDTLAGHPEAAAIVRASGQLAAAEAARSRGAFAEAGQAYSQAAELLRSSSLRRIAKQSLADHDWCASRLEAARRAVGDGRAEEALEALHEVVTRWPTHDAARRELATIEDGLSDRQERLEAAKAAAREGRLRDASAKAVALAIPGQGGADARRLVDDVQARMGLVQRGIDEVMALVHRRESATREGLQHGLGKLDQLEQIQVDHAELPRLRAALQAEIRGLELLERLRACRSDGPSEGGVATLRALIELRGELLSEDRLDARILGAFDEMCARAEEDLEAGRLGEVRGLCSVLAELPPSSAIPAGRLESLMQEVAAREARAVELARAARQRLVERDLSGAEAMAQQALETWRGCSDAQRLEAELSGIRRQEAELDKIGSLAHGDDIGTARRRMEKLPPTPAALRTRIFDMKRDLAQAQGLSAGFVLRVDEGGEFVVVRGDSVSLGNLRQNSADLAILANLAARHAVLQRSMSFHGGMQDVLVAQAGKLYVDGEEVTKVRLADGVCVGLGSSLRLRYTLPSSRSLSAQLQLLGGFQVEGTDRVLVLKDRGRDGRILIGSMPDAHVRVPYDVEVELFSNRSGQICVKSSVDGEIGGRAFRGEHPVTAGEVVRCGELSFVLSPRQAGLSPTR